MSKSLNKSDPSFVTESDIKELSEIMYGIAGAITYIGMLITISLIFPGMIIPCFAVFLCTFAIAATLFVAASLINTNATDVQATYNDDIHPFFNSLSESAQELADQIELPQLPELPKLPESSEVEAFFEKVWNNIVGKSDEAAASTASNQRSRV